MKQDDTAALLILRAALPVICRESCDFTRAAAFELLAKIAPDAESEQLVITAQAVRKSGEAQRLLFEIVESAPVRRDIEHNAELQHRVESGARSAA
jgi:hypothetical protein